MLGNSDIMAKYAGFLLDTILCILCPLNYNATPSYLRSMTYNFYDKSEVTIVLPVVQNDHLW